MSDTKKRLTEGVGYVYALRDPRTKAYFYVGVTVNPWARLEGHRRPHHAPSEKLGQHITAMLSEGVEPEMVLLEKTDFARLLDRENHHMDRLRSEGATLLNVARNKPGKVCAITLTEEKYERVVEELKNGANPRYVGKQYGVSPVVLADLKRELKAAS